MPRMAQSFLYQRDSIRTTMTSDTACLHRIPMATYLPMVRWNTLRTARQEMSREDLFRCITLRIRADLLSLIRCVAMTTGVCSLHQTGMSVRHTEGMHIKQLTSIRLTESTQHGQRWKKISKIVSLNGLKKRM